MKFDKYKTRVLFQSCSKIEMEQSGTLRKPSMKNETKYFELYG